MAVKIPVQVIFEAVDKASSAIKGVGSSFGDAQKDMDRVLKTGVALGAGVSLLAKTFIDQAGAMEQNTIAFETMLGSASAAKTLLADITGFAKKTPFNLTELVEGSKRLLAYNVEAKDLIPTLDVLGNITAGVGREKLPQLILAFGQVKAATKLTGAELRQFSEAGVPLLGTLADQAGVTAGEMVELISKGEVGFPQVEKALASMTVEGGKFHNLMQKQSTTTLGKISNMEDGIQQLQVALGNALLPAVNRTLERIIPLVERFAEFARANPDIVAGFIQAAAAIGAISTTILILTPIVKAMASAFSLMKFAMTAISSKAFLAAMAPILANPITWIILAIAGAIALLAFAWSKNWGDIQGKTQMALAAISGWLQGFMTFMSNVWLSITTGAQTLGNFFVMLGQTIMTAWQGLMMFFASIPEAFNAAMSGIVTFFVTIPELINQFIAGALTALYNFFVIQIPYALGFLAGSFVQFFVETLPMAFLAFVEFMTITVPAFTMQMILWFADMFLQLTTAFITFATITVPETILQMINWLATNIPVMANNFVNWIRNMGTQSVAALNSMRDQAIAAMINLKNQAIQKAMELYAGLVQWIKNTVADTTAAMYTLPGNITAAMNQVKEAAVSKAREIYNGVKEWFDKIVGFFNEIIGKASEALGKAREAFSIGFSGGRRQFGGSVSAASPVLVGEAGPEVFVPSGAGQIVPNNKLTNVGGSGSTTIVFNINSDMIINSPNERRGIAEMLYKDLVTIARSHNTTVADLMGG